MNFRQGNYKDLSSLKNLAINSWGQFQNELTNDNWEKLKKNLADDKTYLELLDNSYCLVCVNNIDEIIGMSFLVPSGNPTEIYDKSWCYIRFVTVDQNYSGHGIGRQLTQMCIQYAKDNNEQVIALHTSEIMNKARHIYESLGFEILKEIEPRLGKKYWLYKLSLT
jgi:ribosomal protein S18 acetylase RimI-like enzyme